MAEQENVKPQKKLSSSWFSTVLSIALVLVMVGLLGVMLINARRISDETKESIDFEIMLQNELEPSEIAAFQKELGKKEYVKATRLVSKEEAAEETIALLGHDFREVVGDILPPSIILNLKSEYINKDFLRKLEKEMQRDVRVFDVQYQQTYVENIHKNLYAVSAVLIGLCVVLLIIAVSLLLNTIRLSIYAKRFLIRSMLYVGAKKTTIRKPFIIKGILQGVWGALIAWLLLAAGLYFGSQFMPGGNFALISLDSATLRWYILLFIALLLFSILITWLSTYLAVCKYIRMKIDKLYF
ncbi:MAG: permease-like cell division protein FtsX [Bacteroidales bacterium]|nr:permease-like cell division protein FtsX [Bacteroidales bacterium]